MKESVKKGFMLGIGAISLTTKAAEKILKGAMKKSRINRKDSEKLVRAMIAQTAKQAKKVSTYVNKELNKQLDRLAKTAKR